MTLSAPKNIAVNNVLATNLATVTATTGTLSVTSGGDVIDSGVLTVGNRATITAVGRDITLNSANNYGSIAFTGHNVLLTESSATDIFTSTATGTFSLTSTGAITDGGVIEVVENMTLVAETTANAANQNITLDSAASTFGGNLILRGANVSVRDSDASVSLGTTTASGLLTITAVSDLIPGVITDSAATAVTAATATFNAGTMGDITLTKTTLTAPLKTIRLTGMEVSVTMATAVDLGTTTVGGDLYVKSTGGPITQSGIVTVVGMTNLIADPPAVVYDITLGMAGNSFGGTVLLTGKSVFLRSNSAVSLGNVYADGTLTIIANGNITNVLQPGPTYGVFDINGAATFNAGTNSITLDILHSHSDFAVLPTYVSGSTNLIVPTASSTLASSITADDIINIAESGSTITITGTVGGDIVNGDIVTLTINGVSTTGAVSSGAFSINVAGNNLSLDADRTINASVITTGYGVYNATGVDTETYTVDIVAPSTTSFALQTPATSPTNADTLVFRVTFNEAVTGVAAADFVATGTTATPSVSAVSTSVYDVTLSGGDLASLYGTVGLNFNSPTITDLAGNTLPNTEPTTDESYFVDNTTLTATIVGNDLVIDDVDGTGKNNVLSVSRSGANLVIADANEQFASAISGAVFSNNYKTITIPATALGGGGKIIVKGQGGSDSLSVDVSTDLGFGVDYQGGSGTSDSLTLVADTVTSVTYAFTNANDGSITIVDGSTRVITFTGLEPITDNLSATDRVFTFNGGDETIIVTDSTASDGKTMIDSTLSESVYFANPTGSLTINAGTGNDTVTITSVDAAYTASLTINGDASTDTVNLNGTITFASGKNLIVNAESVTTGASANLTTSGAGVITLTADDVALNATSTLVSASTVTLKPQTASRAITLGSEVGGQLSLTQTELDRVTAGTLHIGDSASGAITISAALSRAAGHLSLQSGGAVAENAGGTISVTGTNDLAVRAGGAITLDQGNSVRNFAATTTSGGITYVESNSGGAVNINDVDSVGGVSTAGGAISISTIDGPITVSNTASANDVDANTGTVSLTAGQTAGTLRKLTMDNNSVVRGTGGVTFVANDMAIWASGTGMAINGGTNTVTLRNEDTSRAINLGTTTGGLDLTDGELDRITAGTVSIGDTTSGAITFSADITRSASTNINLTTGSGNNIAFSTFSLNAGASGDVTLTTSGSGAITTSDNTGTDLTADDVILNSGSGGVGSTTNFLRLAATTVVATTSGNGSINLIEADSVSIGDNDLNAGTGTITLGGGTFLTTATGSIPSPTTVKSGATLGGIGTTAAITTQSGGSVAPGTSPGILNSGNVVLVSGSTFAVEIGGTTAGNAATNHDQLSVTGTVDLGGATLSTAAFSSFSPAIGNFFIIILNDGSDLMTTTFASSTIINFLGSGHTATISYVGGDGNDVVIIVGP